MSDEKTIFHGSPSQVLNADVLGGCGLVALLLIVLSIFFWWAFLLLLPVPIGIAAWKWLELKCRLFEVTSERIRMSKGIFTRRTDELELYRVNDISVVEPFILRTLGLGHLVITTNDTSTPVLTISAIRGVKELREELRKCVEICRERKRVRVTEME
jgi:uncharacterized membrane protein YdbT with pleckstrin-like domain